MKKVIVAAVAATALLAACGQSSGGGQPSATASCAQQYQQWKHGQERTVASRLTVLGRRIHAATSLGDLTQLRQALARPRPRRDGDAGPPDTPLR
jgi:hypothetical protein